MMIKQVVFLLLTMSCILVSPSRSETVDLSNFNEKLEQANNLDGIAAGSPEAVLLESLNEISSGLSGKELTPEEIETALTLIDSTDLIEEALPKETSISFGDNFLVGSDLSVSDLTNSSFFLNALSAKKLSKVQSIESLSSSNDTLLAGIQNKVLELSNTNVSDLISELETTPEIDLVQLTSAIDGMGEQLSSTINQAENAVAQSSEQLQTASEQISSATQSLSFAAGSAMAAAAYSLDQAATAIANTISAGVTVDLEAASQGMGFDDFASAVDAYNQQYGTSYTTESAKQALGQ
jgi:hypothetical protein